jgi:hypothetical protein
MHMGRFSKAVRYGNIPGPNIRQFEASSWERVAADPNSNRSDCQIAMAGLYFDALLTLIRRRQVLHTSTLPKHSIGRLGAVIANLTYCSLIREASAAIVNGV